MYRISRQAVVAYIRNFREWRFDWRLDELRTISIPRPSMTSVSKTVVFGTDAPPLPVTWSAFCPRSRRQHWHCAVQTQLALGDRDGCCVRGLRPPKHRRRPLVDHLFECRCLDDKVTGVDEFGQLVLLL